MAAAQRTAHDANVRERAADDAARPVRADVAAIERKQSQEADDERRRNARLTFALRLVLTLGALAAALWLLVSQRRRRSRSILAGYSSVGAAGSLALIMGVDYLTDLFDPVELGPLVLSLIGTLLTLAAIAFLQRHLARRLPGRRVRRAECPFCGYPARGEHCEGCGRSIIASCARCGAPRRVGAPHCSACGET